MLKMVTFFLTSGRTFSFRDATIEVDNETVTVVSYRAMSDGFSKRVTFYKANVAGVATCPWNYPTPEQAPKEI